MKIFSWNCNGSFRDDFKEIIDEKSDTYVDADIYVIQECEDPKKKVIDSEECIKYDEYQEFAGNNYFWIGNEDQSKGLGIFAKEYVTLEKIGEWKEDIKYFLAVRVNDSFNLLGVWAMKPSVESIHKFIDAEKNNKKLFDGSLIMCGDFNSNRRWNKEHRSLDDDGNAMDHDHLNCKLNRNGLYSVYHGVTGEKLKNCEDQENSEESKNDEELKQETKNTFFFRRHLNKPYHIDYFYACEKLINNTKWRGDRKKDKKDLLNEFEILERWQWISMSDHLPLVLTKGEEIKFKSEYALQHLTNDNLEELSDLKFITAELQIRGLRIDGLAFNEKTNTFVILEYKKKLDNNVLKQGYDYYELLQEKENMNNEELVDLKENRQAYLDKYEEVFGTKLNEKDIDFSKTKVMIISPKFSKEQIEKSKNPEYPFELYTVALYKHGEKTGRVSYKKVNDSDFNEILDINLDDLIITKDELLEDKSDEIKGLYNSFENSLLNQFKGINIKYLVDAVSIKAHKNFICNVNVKKAIKIHFYTKGLEINKKLEEDRCNKKNLRNISKISTGGPLAYYELTLILEDIEYALDIIKQIDEEKRSNKK